MAKKKGQHGPENIGQASYAVLDGEGKLIGGHNVDVRQDHASTTKMFTLHTIGELDKEGKLPKGFFKNHNNDIERMMVRSDNNAAKRLARAALGSEDAFIERMNVEAQKIGLNNTHFATVDGWPKENHYSTARDMATMAHRFKTDNPDLVEKYGAIERRNTAGALAQEFDGIKTGTATGFHGGQGRYSMVGFTDAGTISVAAAESKGMRASIMRGGLAELNKEHGESIQAQMDKRFRGKDVSPTQLAALPPERPKFEGVAVSAETPAQNQQVAALPLERPRVDPVSLPTEPVKGHEPAPQGKTQLAALPPSRPASLSQQPAQGKASEEAPDISHLPKPKGFYRAGRTMDVDKLAGQGMQGEGSYYDQGFHGKRSASGMRFDRNEFTVAVPRSQSHLYGSVLRVTNPENGKEVLAVATDTGNFHQSRFGDGGRVLDASRKVARELGYEKEGVANLKWEVDAAATAAYREKHGLPYTYASRDNDKPVAVAAAAPSTVSDATATASREPAKAGQDATTFTVAALDHGGTGEREKTSRALVNNTLDALGIKRENDVTILRNNLTGNNNASDLQLQVALRRDVTAIQEEMRKAGVSFGRTDGLLGERTEAALKEFRQKTGKEPEALTRLREKTLPDEKKVASAIRLPEETLKQMATLATMEPIVVAEAKRRQEQVAEAEKEKAAEKHAAGKTADTTTPKGFSQITQVALAVTSDMPKLAVEKASVEQATTTPPVATPPTPESQGKGTSVAEARR